MKPSILKALLAAATLLVSASAPCAPETTAWFSIRRLEASSGSANGYRIYPATGYALPTSQGCSKSDFAEIYQGLYAADRDMIHRTVLAAFMASRQVQLRLDGCGVTGRPAYRIVRVQ